MIRIGAKPFNEQAILAHILGLTLRQKGYEYEVITSEPRLEANLQALERNEIHCYVEYTGTAWNSLLNLPARERWEQEEVYAGVKEGFAARGVAVPLRFGYDNGFRLAMKDGECACISDLAEKSDDFCFTCPEPYISRPDGLPALEKAYGLKFGSITPAQPDQMYELLMNGKADVMTAFVTDARMEKYTLNLLTDDKDALPPYEAVLLARGLDESAVAALSTLEGLITEEAMRRMNYRYDFDGAEPQGIAKEFLEG